MAYQLMENGRSQVNKLLNVIYGNSRTFSMSSDKKKNVFKEAMDDPAHKYEPISLN